MIMWTPWYVLQQLFSNNEKMLFDSFIHLYTNTDTAWWYLWAFLWYPIQLAFDAVFFVIFTPVYIVDLLIRAFNDGKNPSMSSYLFEDE